MSSTGAGLVVEENNSSFYVTAFFVSLFINGMPVRLLSRSI